MPSINEDIIRHILRLIYYLSLNATGSVQLHLGKASQQSATCQVVTLNVHADNVPTETDTGLQPVTTSDITSDVSRCTLISV